MSLQDMRGLGFELRTGTNTLWKTTVGTRNTMSTHADLIA
jgi:hypothetical protein